MVRASVVPMRIDVTSIFDDPQLMFFGFEGDHARFVPMTRETYSRSIFFDQRISAADPRVFRVPLKPLLAHLADTGFKPPRLKFIHHMAQSGSTLLARALDHPHTLVVREPLHLRQLGVGAGASSGTTAAAFPRRSLLAFSLAMLGKRFDASSSLVVKGSVPVSLLAGMIAEMDPGQPAILLHFPLKDYCAAVLRTPNHQRWVESVTSEIGLGGDPLVGDIGGLGTAEKAAALWYSMIKRFERLLEVQPAMRSLDANQLFEQSGEVIAGASDLFDAGLSSEEAKSIASGPLFSTYSKNPKVRYESATRIERREQAKVVLADELRRARTWVERRASHHGLPAALDRPLLGGMTPLL